MSLQALAQPLELRPSAAGAPARRRVRLVGPGLLAAVVYAGLALAADWPIWPGDPSALPTQPGGDITQTVWFLAWTPFALLHGHNLFATNWLNAPVGVDLAQNTGIPLLGLLGAPLTVAVSPVATLNLLRFLAFPLSAGSAYLVFRRWGCSAAPAFLGGLLYGFSPYMVTQGSVHLDLIFVPIPPLLLYASYELVAGERGSAVGWGLSLGALATAQFFISAEVLATTTLLVAIGTVYLLVLRPAAAPRRWRRVATGLACAAGVAAPLVAYPIWMMFHGPAHYVGPAQGYSNVYNADLLGPILPTKAQLVAPVRLARLGTSLVGGPLNVDENGSYLGLPLLVSAAWLVVRLRRRRWLPFLALMAATAFVLSLGPSLHVDRRAERLPVGLPWRALGRLPVLSNVLPVRFSLYVAFFVAAIVALGVEALRAEGALGWREATGRPRARRAATGVVAALAACATCASLVPRWPYRTVRLAPNDAVGPAAWRVLRPGTAVLAYPYPTAFRDNAMLWQALSGMRFRLLGGYALVPDRHGRAWLLPSVLAPERVEAMFIDSMLPFAAPGFPAARVPSAITPSLVAELRRFLRDQRVGAVVVQVGPRDWSGIAAWVGAALGPPTAAFARAEVWTDVGRLAGAGRRAPPRPRLALAGGAPSGGARAYR
ncbi:MAG TPA: hypothetical protein VKV23_10865 [Acidimicrobiales bacterium]|nr:hypothetical protein [Acidimicrobiales bacterium]